LLASTLLFNLLIASLNIVLLAQIAVLFLIQYRSTQELLPLLLMICFFAFVGSAFFYSLRVFAFGQPIYYRLEMVLRFVAFAVFIFMFEHSVYKHHIPGFTIYCGVCIALLFILPYEYAYNFGYTIYPASFVVLYYFLKTIRDSDGKIRRMVNQAILGCFIMGVGIGLSADYVVATGGSYLIAVGSISQLAGLILIGISFYGIRSTDEFSWHKEALNLFVIYQGMCLYAYSIEQSAKIREADLHAGGLATALIVSQGVLKSDDPPNHIEFQNTHFLIQAGKQTITNDRIIAILIVRKDLSLLREKLANFVNSYERKIQDILKEWRGNVAPMEAKGDECIPIFHTRSGRISQ
jgi:hypothetical protein